MALGVDGAEENGEMVNAEMKSIDIQVKALVQSWGISRFSECMARQWLVRLLNTRGDPDGSESSKDKHENAPDLLVRLRKWVLIQLAQQRIPSKDVSHDQHAGPETIPFLRTQPMWDCSEFLWVQALESESSVIKQELLALKDEKGFQPSRANDSSANDGIESVGHDAGAWNVFYLFQHKMDFKKNRSLCPKAVAAIETIGGDHCDHAFFSALPPQTHVKKHHGPTNEKLRCWLPLVVPEGQCRLRVGEQIVKVQEGKCILFDDSLEHETWNDDSARSGIALIIEVWHPDLSDQERRFLRFLRNSRLPVDNKKQSEQPIDRPTQAVRVSSKTAIGS